MERVTLHHPGIPGGTCTLSATHVRLVIAEMERGSGFGSDLGFAVRAAAFRSACIAVRDRHGCLGASSALGRAARLCAKIEDEKAHTPWLRLSCESRELMLELLRSQATSTTT